MAREIKVCKIHGEVEHYKCGKCSECVKARRRARYKDPEKRDHDNGYYKKWRAANPDRVKAWGRRAQIKEKAKREATLEKKRKILKSLLLDKRIEDIRGKLRVQIKDSSLLKLIDTEKTRKENRIRLREGLILFLFQQIKALEAFRLSSCFSYEYRDSVPREEWKGIYRPQYSQLPKSIKDAMKEESRTKALVILNKELIELGESKLKPEDINSIANR